MNLMTAHKAMIAACVSFSLLLGASIYSEARGKSMKSKQDSKVNRSHSDLEQDEIVLIADMRQLRRDLSHRVNRLQIARERDEILQDWLNIVDDRALKRANFSPELANSDLGSFPGDPFLRPGLRDHFFSPGIALQATRRS
jgi:hypothetical protein